MPSPIDPLDGPRFVLEGRVVTMDANHTVVERGRVYVNEGNITQVLPASAAVPPEFAAAPVVDTAGTIYPGLIELHNHLSYNVVPLWPVPRLFTNRDQWSGVGEYRKLVTGPMSILGRTADHIEAIVRYVEAKCLVAGTTTSQGITLQSNQRIIHHYRGIVRNVEQTADPDLPNADTRVADVDAGSATNFLERLRALGNSTLLLHLCEGTDDVARSRFERLRISSRRWAITPELTGIHCAGLTRSNFGTFGRRGGSMVWSPFSNLLLYGATARVLQARAAGVTIALGSDWSPSGSKNLLAELKVADALNRRFPASQRFTSAELVAMVTTNPARILHWDAHIGSLEPGKRADLLAVSGTGTDDYQHLVDATEASVALVVINGVPRYGLGALLSAFQAPTETVRVAGTTRSLFLEQKTADPVVGRLRLSEATDRLRDGMVNLPALARALESPGIAAAMTGLRARGREGTWVLELDHNAEQRHPELDPVTALAAAGAGAAAGGALGAAAPPLSQIVEPMELDALALVDDDAFFTTLARQPNLDVTLARHLATAYGRPV